MKTSARPDIAKGRRAGWNLRPALTFRALGALAVSAAALPVGAQDPSVAGPHHTGRDGREPGRFEFDVSSPPLSRIRIDFSAALGGDWETVAPSVVAMDSLTPMSVPLTEDQPRGFYRAVVEPPQVSVFREQGELVLNVLGDDVSLDEILIGLSHELGEVPFHLLPYDPGSEETDPAGLLLPAVQKGQFRGADLTHLSEQLGFRVWEPPPKEDDEKVAESYKPLVRDQGNPINLPGDGGEEPMEAGWNGDNIREEPGRVDDPPEPGKDDMPYILEVPDEDKDGQADPLVLDPGKHVRLRLRYDGVNFFFEHAVEQDTGNGLLDKPFVTPAEGSFLLVVRNPNGIYHVLPFEDPRKERAYDPPDGGSHGNETAPEGSLRLTLPLLDDNVDKALEGLQIEILEVLRRPDDGGTLLTPDFVARHANDFPLVGAATGGQIAELLAKQPPRQGRAATRDPEVSTLHRSGSNGSKFNVAIMGDGFRDIAGDQALFNTYVEDIIMDAMRNRDIHPAVLNGINIFRVNTFSEQSGITLVDSNGNVTTPRSTALEYRFSGNWNRCWMEPGPNSQALIDAVVDNFCPQADFVVLVLNTTSFGGCAGGNRFTVTRGAGWGVVAHEFGHRPGTLGDEYTCGTTCGCYGGGEPGAGNLTRNTSRSTLKWKQWVPSWRPLPTTTAHIADNTQDVGLFPGATIGSGQWTSCIFRPSSVGRMNNNNPVHNPVGYTNVREQFRPYQKADFRRNVVGDFDGDGRTDAVFLDDRQLSLFLARDRDVGANDPVRGSPPRGVTGVLEPTWYVTDFLRNAAETRSWQIRGTDILRVGDFDGDGMDDLYIINLNAWNKPYVCLLKSFGDRFEPVRRYDGDLPGWQTRSGDEFYVCDFTGDGRDDLLVFNGSNWSIPYFGMLRSTGTSLQMSRRYDKFLPGWEMGRHEKFHVGDFDGDGREEVASFNTQSWSQVHFMVFSSTGTQLSLRDRHYGTIPGFWQMRRNDKLHVLDFTGDDHDDFAIFNGLDWGPVYLGYLQSDDGKLVGRRRYDNSQNHLPGWQMQRRDRWHPADVNGDGRDDLVVYNKDNWSTQYLGIIRSSAGTSFSVTGSWQADWVNGWNLGSADLFAVCDFRGSAGWEDLYVFNAGWFGLLRSYQNHFRLETIYRKWIFNHRYHASGWW